jgi:predicted DNA-binding transcriptional regulator YafY
MRQNLSYILFFLRFSADRCDARAALEDGGFRHLEHTGAARDSHVILSQRSMNRLDRIMGILLLLRGGRVVSATDLSKRFEVSVRTIYRDIEELSGLGVPVAVEMGRTGGFRMREGYFLPPVTLNPEEAASLLLGIILMRRLRVLPFPKEADFAERKLLAALPEETRRLMERASRLIGFERVPADLLHPEPDDPVAAGEAAPGEAEIVGRFLRAVLSRSRVRMKYRSPYRGEEPFQDVEPRGIIWDRDRWYLVGDVEVREGEPRMWRSDRILDIAAGPSMKPTKEGFDVEELLDREWLGKAMARWREGPTARIALTPDQAAMLKRDWYYAHALYEDMADGRVALTYGEDDPEAVAALVRWLGPGAELVAPAEWRPIVAAGLRRMLEAHE